MRAMCERYFYVLPRNSTILTVGDASRCKHLPVGLCSREVLALEGNQYCETAWTRLPFVFWQHFENLIVWGNYSLVKQKQQRERQRNAKYDTYCDSSTAEFAIWVCHNLHLHLHFNCSVKTFALEQIQEYAWNMHPHTATSLGWMPNLLQWEDLAVGRVSEDEIISFSVYLRRVKRALAAGTADEHSPAQETK